jgi:hypothetical protein
MKSKLQTTFLSAIIASVVSSGLSQAQTTYTTATSGPYSGDVVNSTYTFSGLPANTTGFTAILEQTQIPQNTLNSIAPPANFELEITSLKYVDTQNLFYGTGAPLDIDIAFTVQPTIQQGASTTAMLSLVTSNSYTGNVQASNQNPIVFTLANPVAFPLSTAQNLGNLASVQPGNQVSTWNDGVSNIHANGPATSVVAGQTYTYNLNGTFSNLGGSLEVTYVAVAPEPKSVYLVAGGVALLAVLYRRRLRS